jgi:hypothetical protein
MKEQENQVEREEFFPKEDASIEAIAEIKEIALDRQLSWDVKSLQSLNIENEIFD